MAYAADTQVSPARSREELEKLLAKHGALRFGYVTEPGVVQVAFVLAGRQVRFTLPLPTEDDRDIAWTAQGQRRSEGSRRTALAKAERSRWRALVLIVKAKLEAIDTGLVTFDEEFLAHLVIPDGRTVGQAVVPELDRAIAAGGLPALTMGPR